MESRLPLAGDITYVNHFDLWDGGIVPSTDAAGVTYHPPSGHLYIADSEINELSSTYFTGDNVFEVDLAGNTYYNGFETNNREPTGITYNEFDGFFYVTNDDTQLIYRYDDSLASPLATTSTTADEITAYDPEGITSDPATGDMWVVSGDTGPNGSAGVLQVLRYGNDFSYQGRFLIGGIMTDAEGIAFHAPTQHLFIVSGGQNKIVEFTTSGAVVEEYDISGFSPTPDAAQGLSFGPTSDPFDDPANLSLYIADGMQDNYPDGRIYEAIIGTSSGPTNLPPTVDAGGEQTVLPGETAFLNGSIGDDGLPSGTLTSVWTKFSGPGSVTFGDAAQPVTTAQFSAPGVYVLQLTASDGSLQTSSVVNINVGVERSVILASTDDVEERATGAVRTGSSDLQMTLDADVQTVGLRFTNIQVPNGAVVTNAYVQFQADETNTEATSLIIHGQAIDDAPTFSSASFDVTSRSQTSASVAWIPPAWNTVGEAGPDQQTPNLASILNEIVSRPGWANGNAVALIIGGSGVRTAEAFDGTAAPALMIEFDVAQSANLTPILDPIGDRSVEQLSTLTFMATAMDQDVPPDNLTYSLDPGAPAGAAINPTTGEFTWTPSLSDAPGQYPVTIRVTDDGTPAADDFETFTVTVSPLSPVVTTVQALLTDRYDDAEEQNGDVRRNSTTLDLLEDNGINQTVGLLYRNLNIPQGATIVNASIQFTAYKPNDGDVTAIFQAQSTGDAPLFSSSDFDLSSRPKTSASVSWNPAPWTRSGDSGPDQLTPNLASVVQEVVDRGDWSSGNALAILITGTGNRRRASSYNDGPSVAPVLAIDYFTGPTNSTPTTNGFAGVSVVEEAGSSVVDLFAAFDDTEDADTLLTYTVVSNSNPSLFVSTPIDGIGGTLTLNYAADIAGEAELIVRATDTEGAFVDASLLVSISEINDPPVQSAGVVSDLTVGEDAGATSLGLGALQFTNGGGADEASQSLTYSVTATPGASLGHVLLADGFTVVAPGTYTLMQIQGMQFRPAANAVGGPESFDFSVTDDGTTNGIADPLAISVSLAITVTEQNDLPVRLAGIVADLEVLKDVPITSLDLGALAYGPGGGTDETGQSLAYAVTAVPSAALGEVRLADGLTAVLPGPYTLNQIQGMQFLPAPGALGGPEAFTFTVSDDGTTNGTSDPQLIAETIQIGVFEFNATPTTTGLAAVNELEDASDAVVDLFAAFDDAETADIDLLYSIESNSNSALFSAATINGLAGELTLSFAPDAVGTSELVIRATDDGTNPQFVEATLLVTLAESNDVPVVVAGAPANLTTAEGVSASLNLGALAFGPGGGADETAQSLSYAVTAVPSAALGSIFLSDGLTLVAPGAYALGQIQGMQFVPAIDANGGPESFAVSATDDGTTNGSADPQSLTVSLQISVTEENDPPLRIAGTVADLTVVEDSPATSLGLGGLAYSTGGGLDELTQTLTFNVTSVPAAALGDIVLADGFTVVAPGSYSLAQVQGMQFLPTPSASGGPATFSFSITDDGTTDGGLDPQTIVESLDITITPLTPVITTVQSQITDRFDDAEEQNGDVRLNSTTLDLLEDNGINQTVGLLYRNLSIPQGATIVNASIQFTTFKPNDGDVTAIFQAQATGDAVSFSSSNNDLSSRPKTSASVSWNPAPWNSSGQSGPEQLTPNLASVIQEVVDRGDWSSGNALAILITGTGNRRRASSYNDSPADAPVLTVDYTLGAPLRAAAAAPTPVVASSLTSTELQPIFDEAVACISSGSDSVASMLEGLQIEIVDLPGDLLGLAQPGVIQIDFNAAGWGWFVDATPADNLEFYVSSRPSDLLARGDSPAANRIDLLTVVMHELLHARGLEHSESGLMSETLDAGMRRLLDGHATDGDDFESAADEFYAAIGN
ncbi:MAG: putative Ig domain-containing protein [Planctomycetales bacterium]|nr:putative Ig domain-containing protein [Planctomycetales bacterium]